MSEISRRLIRRALSDLERSQCASVQHRAINFAYATAMIELAYAESLITDAEHDEFRRQAEATDKQVRIPSVDVSAWQPCNPGCDPEFNGEKSRHCSCDPAKAAMAAQEVIHG